MKYRLLSIALSAAVLALSAATSFGAETQAIAPAAAASEAAPIQAKAPAASASKAAASQSKAALRRKEIDAQRQAAAKIKLVDINSASSEELTKLPGIGETDAAKIIAGRPYGSKSWLMTHKVLPAQQYEGISNLIAAKNAAKLTAKLPAKK